MKKTLFTGTAVAAFAAISAPILAMDIDFSGRSRFNLGAGENYITPTANGAIRTSGGQLVHLNAAGHKRLPNGGIVPSSKVIIDPDAAFTNDERLHVNVSESTCCFEYGGMLRLEDANIKSDIFVSGNWGRLDYGNIDNARVGAYDVSVLDAGPLSASSSVAGSNHATAAAPLVAGGLGAINDFKFDDSTVGDTNIVYTAPSGLFGGIGFKAATDGEDFEAGVTMDVPVPGLGTIGIRATVDSDSRYAAMATGTIYGFDVAAWTSEDDDDDRQHGAAIARSFGKYKLSVSNANLKGRNSLQSANGTGFASQQDLIGGISYQITSGLKASASVRNRSHSAFGDVTDYKARLQLDF